MMIYIQKDGRRDGGYDVVAVSISRRIEHVCSCIAATLKEETPYAELLGNAEGAVRAL